MMHIDVHAVPPLEQPLEAQCMLVFTTVIVVQINDF